VIHVSGLRKVFRHPRRVEGPFGAVRTLLSREVVETVAVHDVSFDVDEGELVGYLGPNGAGKSTTVKMLTGVLTPTSGEVVVRGATGPATPGPSVSCSDRGRSRGGTCR
jgi:ABC-2 type transport system ATP-binding protein